MSFALSSEKILLLCPLPFIVPHPLLLTVPFLSLPLGSIHERDKCLNNLLCRCHFKILSDRKYPPIDQSPHFLGPTSYSLQVYSTGILEQWTYVFRTLWPSWHCPFKGTVQRDFLPPVLNPSGPRTNGLKYFQFYLGFRSLILSSK